MKKYTLGFIFISLLLSFCSSNDSIKSNVEVPYVENPLEPVLVIGEEELPDDYLLAKPNCIAVNSSGEIIAPDEHHLKVYSPDGEPLRLLGGKGQGPGEFEAPFHTTVSPTDYITAMDILWEYNVYGPDMSFISKTRIKTNDPMQEHKERENLSFTMLQVTYSLNSKERIIGYFGQDMEIDGKFPVFKYILHLKPDTCINLVKYHSKSSIKNKNGGGSNSIDFQGDLEWGMIDETSIVYTNTYYDHNISETGADYSLFIQDIFTGDTDTMKVQYSPIEIPSDLKKLEPYVNEHLNMHIPVNPERQAILNDTKYFPHLYEIRTDGDIAFVFYYNAENEAIEKYEDDHEDELEDKPAAERAPYEAEVIDLTNKRVIARTTFAFIPDVIKNGYAYILNKPNDAFPTIEKHKVNPALYNNSAFQ